MTKTNPIKPLKEQNRTRLWLILVANAVALYSCVKFNAVTLDGFSAYFKNVEAAVPIGLAFVMTTLLTNLISPAMKARLVFLRWQDALPGHRAFTVYAISDPRIDMVHLANAIGGPLPVNQSEQNRVWYRAFKTVEGVPAVHQAHRDYLLLRDYTSLGFLFIVILGPLGFYLIKSEKVALTYLVVLFLQYCLARQAATYCGIRMVTNVLAEKAASSL